MPDPNAPCNGCTQCAMRCVDGIRIAEYEYARMVEELQAADPALVFTVLEQDKTRVWFEGVHYTACLFLDLRTERCLVYAARPLVCRLFGQIRHLPCPIERITPTLDAAAWMAQYSEQSLMTFQAWMAECGVFSIEALLGAPDPRCIEISDGSGMRSRAPGVPR